MEAFDKLLMQEFKRLESDLNKAKIAEYCLQKQITVQSQPSESYQNLEIKRKHFRSKIFKKA